MFGWLKNLFSKSSGAVPIAKQTEQPVQQEQDSKPAVQPKQTQTQFSDRFDKFIPFVLEAECVFAKGHYNDYNYVICEDVPGDDGGLTKFGIDASGHPGVDIKNLNLNTAEAIYFKEWQNENVETYPFPLGEAYYDSCVNAGLSRSRTFMQQCGGDVKKYLQLRADFYIRLANSVSHDKQFLKGWLNRINDVATYLKIDFKV